MMKLRMKFSKAGAALAVLGLVWTGACAPALPAPGAQPPTARDTTSRTPAREAPLVRLGVLLPQGGALQPYATAILDGVRVAAAQHEARGEHRVELVVRDATTAAQSTAAVREMSEAGVVGIVGPLLEENIAVAARARPDAGLLLISPTGTQSLGLANVYTLNVPDTLGAAALGEYAARAGGAGGVLYARSPEGSAQARAFRTAYQRASGRAPTELAFGSGTTTFAAPLRRLRDAGVQRLLLAGSESDVRQILPQISYYGLRNAEVLGTGSWVTPEGLRRVGLEALEGAVLAVPFIEGDASGGWARFRAAYEQTHRRSLENAMPALGYDAALLILAGLPDGRVDAADARRALGQNRTVEGATGRLVVRESEIARAPRLVRVQGGELIPVRER